jgi:molybdopterin synthase sulfur carrier subunit
MSPDPSGVSMVQVFIPASLRPLADGQRSVELAGNTVRDVVLQLESRYPGLIERLREGDSLRPGLAVSIDSGISNLGLRQTLPPGCEVHFIPTVGGG